MSARDDKPMISRPGNSGFKTSSARSSCSSPSSPSSARGTIGSWVKRAAPCRAPRGKGRLARRVAQLGFIEFGRLGHGIRQRHRLLLHGGAHREVYSTTTPDALGDWWRGGKLHRRLMDHATSTGFFSEGMDQVHEPWFSHVPRMTTTQRVQQFSSAASLA